MLVQGPDRRVRAARRNERIYLTGLGCSLIGNSALSLVAGIWVKSLTGSSSAAGLVSVCIYLPSLLGPLGGLLADRVPVRPLLIALDVVSGAVVLGLLLVDTRADVWLIYAVMLWYGTALMLAGPAESVLFVRLFDPPTRARINGRSVALQEIGRLVSPLLGAGLFAAAGGGPVAALDAVTFVVGALATTMVRVPARSAGPPRAAVRARVGAGVRALWAVPELRATAVLAVVPMFVSGMLVSAQYSLVGALHRSPAFLGVLAACLGAGSVVASLAAGRIIGRIGERRLATLAVVDFVVGSALRATATLAPAVLGSLVLGAALPWSLIALITAGQRLADREIQGQVSAAITLVMFAPQPVALALGAALIDNVDFRALYAAGALVSAAVLAVPRVRRRRDASV